MRLPAGAPMENDDRRQLMRTAVNTAAAPITAAGHLCELCVTLLEVHGAGVSLRPDGAADATLGSAGGLVGAVAELQFTLGEGPSVDAVTFDRVVLVADLERDDGRWPVFTPAAVAEGVGAMFVFPVRLRKTAVGSLDLIRRTSGALSTENVKLGEYAAELAAGPLREWVVNTRPGRDADDHGNQPVEDDLALERVEIYQATGMVMGQMDVGADEALVRLRAYAYLHDVSASEVAWRIVARRLRFTTDGDGEDAGESRS